MRKAKLLHTMLFSLPGTPVIYYGDELGMGDNYYLGDRDGVRTPMQWSPDKNAGFSRANPQQLYLPVIIDFDYHYTTVNIESQIRNPSSFLVWVRHFIGLRKHFKVFGRGSFEIIHSNNRKVFAYIREYEDERILVAVNLSRHPQVVALDISRYAGMVPEEMFSRGKFLPVREEPYVLTFAPYGTYLFLLKKEEATSCVSVLLDDRHIKTSGHWTRILQGETLQEFEENAVIPYMSGCRWFGGKARTVQFARIEETIPVGRDPDLAHILLLRVQYTEGLSDLYILPIAFAAGAAAERILEENSQAAISRVSVDGTSGIIYDAVYNQSFCSELLSLITRRKKIRSANGELASFAGKALRNSTTNGLDRLSPRVLAAEQSNTSILYGEELFLKIYRHPDVGINPDLEISRFLTETVGFRNIPVFSGGIEYRRDSAEPITLGILVKYVPSSRDTWQAAIDNLKRYYEGVISKRLEYPDLPEFPVALLDAESSEIPGIFKELAGELLVEMAGLLGRRTAEMHLSLALNNEDPAFKPEPFSLLWQRSVFQSMQGQVKKVFRLLETNLVNIPEELKTDALELLRLQSRITENMRAIVRGKLEARKIRIHGDYHLGQVLYTGKDFIIIDFEGEPARTLTERRLKRSPLRDVAGMIRSFHYAAYLTLYKEAAVRTPEKPALEAWADLWYRCVSGSFLQAYFDVMNGSGLIPRNRQEIEIMLNAFLLDKAVYEVGYELNNRPQWVWIPIRGIRQLMEIQ
jgi:maltose alpha-D-glucosyltransferase/alpha-amylase